MIVVVMGVSGSGKTTVGRLLAEQLGWKFHDADDFHHAANVEKMRRGEPLSDSDRNPWLRELSRLINETLASDSNAVLACSALKSDYRRYLLIDGRVRLVYLKGDYFLIEQRLNQRQGHYMKAELLESQFAALEEPENAIVVDIAGATADIVEMIREKLVC